MSELFLKIVNMSISAGWVVLAVLILRLLLRKAPKWITVLMWGIVAVRLVCPFTIESVLSLIPSTETVSHDIMMDPTPTVQTGVPVINNSVNPIITETLAPASGDSVNPLQIWIPILSAVWLAGVTVLLVYTLISYIRLRLRVRTAVSLRDNVYESENISSPFVLGVIRPRIYLPFNISVNDAEHVIAHEQAHIRRKDHLWKPIGFLLLTVHWFNPLVWLGYVLLCRDIELACDEKVVKTLDFEQRADYSQALLNCSVNRRMIAACPLAFGEVGVKDRVKSVLNYKKPAFWIIIIAIIASVIVAVCFLTDPKGEDDTATDTVLQNIDSFSELEGVYLTITTHDRDSAGFELLRIVWHNETATDIRYSESYSLEHMDGDEWNDIRIDGSSASIDGGVIESGATKEIIYTTRGFDVSMLGTYRLSSSFTDIDGKEYRASVTYSMFSPGFPPDRVSSVPTVPYDDIQRLKSKYPMYFDLPTTEGLEVYVWQMSKNTYSCGLLPGRKTEYTDEEIWSLHASPATLEEMRIIVGSYGIPINDVDVCPIVMPHSSYAYTIDEKYSSLIDNIFWSGLTIYREPIADPTIDEATFDIDGDGKVERCRLTYGPTSGVFTFCLMVGEINEHLEYCNVFNARHMVLSFEEKADGTVVVKGESEGNVYYMDIEIIDGNISLNDNGQGVIHGYWGFQGVY